MEKVTINGMVCPLDEMNLNVLYNGTWNEIFWDHETDEYIIVNGEAIYFYINI
jgi:hypothetical protein